MTASVSAIPLSIDYTSRDFYSLREDLVQLVKNRVNVGGNTKWTGDDPSDFGIALIEAFAYVGDLTNYYIDRIANEVYLPTATQRRNVINLATLYGYAPTGYRAASTIVTFTNTREDDGEELGEYTLPAGTQVTGNILCDNTVQEVIFTTLGEVTIPASASGVNGTADVLAVHGEYISTRTGNTQYGESLGRSSGQANQIFVLSENQVVDGSVTVYVENGDLFEEWKQVSHLTDYGPYDAVYQLSVDENNFVAVQFGDGISGAIPNTDESVSVDYTVGGGSIGNVPTGTLTSLLYVPDELDLPFVSGFISVTNADAALGGEDPEDTSLIRNNSVKAIRAINRAVSLQDYSDLVLGETNVGKANASADVWSSVNLYIAPSRNSDSQELYPGFDGVGEELTPEWDELTASVEAYLQGKVQIGTTVSVLPPSYVPVQVNVGYVLTDTSTVAQAEEDIRSEIIAQYSYYANGFEQTITPEDIERVLYSLPSIRSARVTALYRVGGAVQRAALIGGPGELFVFAATAGNISITNEGSISTLSNNASLSALSSNNGTLSATFSSTTYYYSLNSVTSTSIVLTPVAALGATIAYVVNGTSQTSSTIATPDTELTIIDVQVTSGDGTSSRSYVLKVDRTA